MKRPRENKHAINRENDFSLLTKGATEAVVDEMNVASSAREQPHRRCGSRRRLLQTNVWFGAFLVVAVALLSGIPSPLPVAHASMTTTSTKRIISSAKLATVRGSSSSSDEPRDVLVFGHRRIEEESESESVDEGVTAESLSNAAECTEPVGKCVQCTYSEQKTFDACAETQRWQKFQCPVLEGSSEDASPRYEMRSCKHTDLDSGLAMFQFQIFCLLIGALSIVSVKKQKKLSLSMFDRRKQQGANSSARSNMGSNKRSDEEDIEFTPMTNQQRERVPLVQRMESMEII